MGLDIPLPRRPSIGDASSSANTGAGTRKKSVHVIGSVWVCAMAIRTRWGLGNAGRARTWRSGEVGVMRKRGRIWIAVALVAAYAGVAHADYIVTPLVGGTSSANVFPGDLFDLDIVLTSDAGDQHNSAIFRLEFWTAGLAYDWYEWAAPYETGTIWDDSHPFLTDLSVTLGPDTFIDPVNPIPRTDIELSNVVPIGQPYFGEGTLVTLGFHVPVDFPPNQIVLISVVPNASNDPDNSVLVIANGFDIIPSTPGPVFALHILPEPGAGQSALIVLLVALARPRPGAARTA